MNKIIVILLMAFMLGGCTKNEFTVEVEQSSGMSPIDMKVIYYASDKRGGTMTERELPAAVATLQKVTCPARYPALCFLYTSSRLLTVFWAERGDHIALHCKENLWTATGNAVNDSLARWQALNRNILQAKAYTDINRKVSQYVKSHPKSRVSAILLYVYFNAALAPEEFEKLRASLRGDAADTDIIRATGITPQHTRESPRRLPPLWLHSFRDSVVNVKFAIAPATILLFWENQQQRNESLVILNRAVSRRAGIQHIDINMQPDTMNWRYILSADSVKTWRHLWAPGAEQTPQLLQYAVGAPNYIMVVNSKGETIYRGTDAQKAADHALKAQ